MKDIFGNELKVGDEVAFNMPYYKTLRKGIIKKFGEKMILITYAGDTTHRVYPEDCVKNLNANVEV